MYNFTQVLREEVTNEEIATSAGDASGRSTGGKRKRAAGSRKNSNQFLSNRMDKNKDFILGIGFLVTLIALILNQTSQTQALSLISEKCDPAKVGPDETTVKGGWQAEMFNGLSFRACGKC